MKAVPIAFGLVLLLAGVAAAAQSPNDPSYASVDRVTYYIVAGMANGSALASQAGGGEVRQNFIGCAFAQMRPDRNNGRIQVTGFIDDSTDLKLEVDDFAGTKAQQGGIATNLTLDPTVASIVPAGSTIGAEAAAWGTANMWAGFHLEPTPLGLQLVRSNFTDPVGGGEDLDATFVSTHDGLRDLVSGSPLAEPKHGQDEIHLVLTSPAGATPTPDKVQFVGPANLPDGSMAADAEHSALYSFIDTRFGGQATIAITATSKAAPGFNELTLHVLQPDGLEVGNTSVTSSVVAPGTSSIKVPLAEMGSYTLAVGGKLLMGSYTVDVQLDPAPSFRLDFWWSQIARGEQGRSVTSDCQRQIGVLSSVSGPAVGRHKPPLFPLEVVALAAVAALITVLLITKYISESVQAGEFKRQFRK